MTTQPPTSFVLLPATTAQGEQTFVRIARSSLPSVVPVQPAVKSIEDFRLKVFDNDGRRRRKTFSFSNFKTDKAKSLKNLKKLIETEFGADLATGKVNDVGYFDGPTRLWIRSDAELTQVVERIKKVAKSYCGATVRKNVYPGLI